LELPVYKFIFQNTHHNKITEFTIAEITLLLNFLGFEADFIYRNLKRID